MADIKRLLAPLLLIPLLLPAVTHAASLADLRLELRSFQQSDDASLAPQTTAKAADDLRAAQMAADQKRQADAEQALQQASDSLTEAKRIAGVVRTQYADVLQRRQDCAEVQQVLADSNGVVASPAFMQAKQQADSAWSEAIRSLESGNLNASQQQANSADQGYVQALKTVMPDLTALARDRLAKASSAGARRYAIHTYATAKEKIDELRKYNDGLARTPPERPADAVRLADKARSMAETIRQMRRDSNSYEMLLLEEQQFRQNLAIALGMPIDLRDPLADASRDAVLTAARKQARDLAEERQLHAKDLEVLQQARAKSENLEAQQQQMAQASESMKEAFRAKLERETFETNRQKQVRDLIHDGEAEVMVNLDGSLLIRLSALKFAPGQSGIDRKYHDFLRRIKDALNVYADRNVRIEGHTDNKGDVKANQQLSLKRAEAVRDFLAKAGVERSRMQALGYGEVRPIASNEFEKGRAMNRRIDIVIEAPHE